MSAKSFGKLYQAERKVLNQYHRQQNFSEDQLPLSTVLEEFQEQAIELANGPKKPSAQAKHGFFGKSTSRSKPKITGPTDFLDLEVRIELDQEHTPPSDEIFKSHTGDNASSSGDVQVPYTDEDFNPKVSPGRGVPFVSYVPDDMVALCSSGGGIRSAIFNLGVLQGLDRLGLLPLIDYHSTVSGGGYLGGWWTTWRTCGSDESSSSQNMDKSDKLYPQHDKNLVEHQAIRRLREHSRFLSPTGFALSAEIWSGMLLWALGIIGTLLMALSVVSAGITIWAFLHAFLDGTEPYYNNHLLALLGFGVLLCCISEWVPLPIKLTIRRFGVGLFLASGVALGLDGLWGLANSVKDQTLFAFLSSVAIGGAGSWVIRWLTDWGTKKGEKHAPNSFMVRVSHYLPQLVATLVIASMAFVLMLSALYFELPSIAELLRVPIKFTLAAVALSSTFGLAFLGHLAVCTPSTLHRFYRRRIKESFLQMPHDNSSEPGPAQNWPEYPDRPIQLVNCCASDTCYSTTDQIDRRGTNVGLSAIGAYPSRNGVVAHKEKPSLGEAITASAAAVDPSMGIYSAQFGRLVAFVLFALNLRLGIWWKPNHSPPKNCMGHFHQYLCSWFSLRPWKEMFSQITMPKPSSKPNHVAYNKSNLDLRLTDGGHFDNLAAYEMIRRRCRYIVICDGGADQKNHFTELSSLQRLVRRDFGVEIDIDLDPLRTDSNGLSQRHLAAGRIIYPAASKDKGFSDDGILIYVKPSLTGDEPEDLTQYQAASSTFPHETTADQFFDDKQWEAYRKLGEHSITQDLKFVEKYLEKDGKDGTKNAKKVDPKRAARLFNAAIRELGSEDHQIRTARANAAGRFVERLGNKSNIWIEEFLSELRGIDSGVRHNAKDSLLATMGLLEELEEAYYRCDLKRHGDHLENWGIENRVDRLAASAEVRRWWSVLAPLYSIPFHNYLGEKYGLDALLPLVNRKLVTLSMMKLSESITDSPHSKSIQRIQRSRCNSAAGDNDWVLCGTFQIDDFSIDLGAIAFTLIPIEKRIEINSEDMQIAPGFWSIGHNAILMDALLDFFGFSVSSSPSKNKPMMPTTPAINSQNVDRIVVELHRSDPENKPEKVRRPDHRHSWIQRGFVQTPSGRLVRDQKDLDKAGIRYNIQSS